MITVQFIIRNAQGVELAREVLDQQPCGKYELEIVGFGSVLAHVTEWEHDGKSWVPKDPEAVG